jgi:cellulose synthase/poly-beta-1,6-N-acetylglucosamine synthase-like glycosyltransferase
MIFFLYLFTAIILAIQLVFWLSSKLLIRELRSPASQPTRALVPLSVIITARNERSNLMKNLPFILNQNYPNYEVLVVDDASTDDSLAILDYFKGQYAHLLPLQIEQKKRAGKKDGLLHAIKNAQYEWLVFTDADCMPTSKQWLQKLAAKCDEKTDIILGYSPYSREKGVLNDFIRYETFMTAVIYGTFTLSGLPYMGIGRNMAYRKSKFLGTLDGEKFFRMASGDDDLAVNAMASSTNTVLQFEEDARVLSTPKSTFSDFIRQKTRHLAPSTQYRKKHQWLLGIWALSQALFYPVIFLMILIHWEIAILVLLLRMFVVLPVKLSLMGNLGVKDLRPKGMLLDAQFSIYYWYMGFKWLGTKTPEWR